MSTGYPTDLATMQDPNPIPAASNNNPLRAPSQWALGTRISVAGEMTEPLEELISRLMSHVPGGRVLSVRWRFDNDLTTRVERLAATLVERLPAEPGGRDRMAWRLVADDNAHISGHLEILGDVRLPGEKVPGILEEMLGEGLDDTVRPGVRAALQETVNETNTTRHLGGRALLATPNMVLAMERVSAEASAPYINDGFGTVGAHNDIAHLRPAYLGESVSYTAILIGITGRRLTYEVEARVGERIVGAGRHEGHVVWTRFGDSEPAG